MKTDGSLLWQL